MAQAHNCRPQRAEPSPKGSERKKGEPVCSPAGCGKRDSKQSGGLSGYWFGSLRFLPDGACERELSAHPQGVAGNQHQTREGFEVNPKRVVRLRREEGLRGSKKQRRMERLGASTAQRARAERPRQV